MIGCLDDSLIKAENRRDFGVPETEKTFLRWMTNTVYDVRWQESLRFDFTGRPGMTMNREDLCRIDYP